MNRSRSNRASHCRNRSELTLRQRRLERREINPKEAFTIRDGSACYFRASLKELNADGGLAVPYERMVRSPESSVEITLACSVLARQRMIFVMQKATELGVTRIVPLLTDHSVPREGLDHERANAWPCKLSAPPNSAGAVRFHTCFLQQIWTRSSPRLLLSRPISA